MDFGRAGMMTQDATMVAFNRTRFFRRAARGMIGELNARQRERSVVPADVVLAINGQELTSGDNYERLLSTIVNDYVPVTLAKSASGDGARTVRIASVRSPTDIKYEEWVATRNEQVEKETNGGGDIDQELSDILGRRPSSPPAATP